MVEVLNPYNINLTTGHFLPLGWIDGDRIGKHWWILRPNKDNYVEFHSFVPPYFPINKILRIYFVGYWNGNETIDQTMKISLWYKGENEEMITPNESNKDIIVKAALQNRRISSFYYDIVPNTLNLLDYFKIRIRRNNTIGDNNQLFMVQIIPIILD